MGKKLHILFLNNAAGESFIASVDYDSNWTYQDLGGAHFTNVFESFNYEEVESYLREMEKITTRYCVYYDNDDYYIRKLNCSNGNIQSNKPSYNADALKFFDTYKQAEEYINA